MSKAHMRIGQVCRMLKDEFPDVSISKLRFLEEQGLVRPDRTPGGYRMYGDAHVAQLRHILQMQRDEFLPLKVIRDELQRRLGEGDTAARRGGSGRVSLTAPEQHMGAAELCERAQVPTSFLEECISFDIVAGARRPSGELAFSAQECELVRAAFVMARLGIDVRHLRQVRTAAGRLAALVEQYAAARLRAPNPEARAEAMRSVEALTGALGEFIKVAFVRDVKLMTARAFGGAAAARPEAMTTR